MNWHPIETLPVSHYATVQRAEGPEADIYRASETSLLNVTTGQPVTDATVWRPRNIKRLPIGE